MPLFLTYFNDCDHSWLNDNTFSALKSCWVVYSHSKVKNTCRQALWNWKVSILMVHVNNLTIHTRAGSVSVFGVSIGIRYLRLYFFHVGSVSVFLQEGWLPPTKCASAAKINKYYRLWRLYFGVFAAILEIFNVKERPDLEIWVWGPLRSLKKARFDRPCMPFY